MYHRRSLGSHGIAYHLIKRENNAGGLTVGPIRGGIREAGPRLCWVGKSVKKAVMESGGMRRTEKVCEMEEMM